MSEFSTLFSIFIVGLSYGTTACMFSCMPFLTPILATNQNSTKEALRVVLPFSFGRIISYMSIAVLSFYSSLYVKKMLDNTTFANIFVGVFIAFIGMYMFYDTFEKTRHCSLKKDRFYKKNNILSLFLVGLLMAINPCAPLMSLIGVAMTAKSFVGAIFVGLSFGIGVVLFSVLFYGVVFAKLINGVMLQFVKYKIVIQRVMALFMMLLGVLIALGKVSL